VDPSLALRPLQRAQWGDAMAMAARAFLDEPFLVTLFGADPLVRLAKAYPLYLNTPWDDTDRHVGAFAGPALVGVVVVSPPGACRVCRTTDPHALPTDPLEVVDWEFDVQVQAAHADHGAHSWIGRVAVEPAVQGSGIGRALMAEAQALLAGLGGGTVLLECLPSREGFYAANGFVRVGMFPDPAGPDALLMRADLDPTARP